MSSIAKINLEQLSAAKPIFSQKNGFAEGTVLVGKKPLAVKLVGTVFMLPRRSENKTYGIQYSMGVKFNVADMIVFDTLLNKMGQLAGDGFQVKYAHDKGKIFLKLKVNEDGTKFNFVSNIPIDPRNLSSLKVEKGSEVSLEIGVDGWYLKAEDKKSFGIKLEINKIFFGQEPKPRNKKRKTSEDEVSSPDSN